jgi:hypothetical protein
MHHHAAMLGAAAARPPFADYPGLDPFRDHYLLSAGAGRDPLREARERELLRLSAAAANPLSSLMNSELERAKALSMASSYGYPPLSATPGYPGYPGHHKLVGPSPHHLAGLYGAAGVAATPPAHPGLSHLGLNGVVPGGSAPTYGKDPLRR